MIIRESMEDYLARPAMSSSMAWDIVNECPAYAHARSPFCPTPVKRESTDRMDFGTIAHLAVLEPDKLEDRVDVCASSDWRTKSAQELRERAVSRGHIPMLSKDFNRVLELRESLKESEAAPYLFGEGESEVTFTWEVPWPGTIPFTAPMLGTHPPLKVPCKARIDRLAKIDGHSTLVHLKTSESANPVSFAQVAGRLGYDLADAWYRDGWRQQEEWTFEDDSVFVVVSSHPPHMVTLVDLDIADVEGGRTLCNRALAEFARAQETRVWRGYGQKPGRQTIRMPAWYRRNMFEMEGVSR